MVVTGVTVLTRAQLGTVVGPLWRRAGPASGPLVGPLRAHSLAHVGPPRLTRGPSWALSCREQSNVPNDGPRNGVPERSERQRPARAARPRLVRTQGLAAARSVTRWAAAWLN